MYSPIKTLNIARLIKEACDLDIMVYDIAADSLSKKLFYIMLNVIEMNDLETPTHLFVSPTMVPELSEMVGCFKPHAICGLEIHYIKGLGHQDDYDEKTYWKSPHGGRHIKYFYSLGGYLAPQKESLVMMGTREKVLLGCY